MRKLFVLLVFGLVGCQSFVKKPIQPLAKPPSPAPVSAPVPQAVVSTIPQQSETSEDMKVVQKQLNAWMAFSKTQQKTLVIDGVYGVMSTVAISNFQLDHKLEVAPLNLATLTALNIKVNPPASNNSSGSPVLEWEKDHPERAAWTSALFSGLETQYDSFNKATDWDFFCPNYSKLNHAQKVKLWATVIEWDAWYESNWDATSYSVDAGVARNKNTWSVGLLQVSVIDQDTYRLSFGYTFVDLQQGPKNLRLGTAILSQQIERFNKVRIKKGGPVYWSTLSPGNKYDRSENIAIHSKQLGFCQ